MPNVRSGTAREQNPAASIKQGQSLFYGPGTAVTQGTNHTAGGVVCYTIHWGELIPEQVQ